MKSCKTCRFHITDSIGMLCNFPLIAEMFLDGIVDENPTNMSNGGINCSRHEKYESEYERSK